MLEKPAAEAQVTKQAPVLTFGAPAVPRAGLPDRTATAKLLLAGSCRLRVMDRPVSDYPDDVTVYLVVNDFGKFGKAYVETDIAEADREAIIRNFISGQYSNALRVVAFNTAEGWSRDVSEDIA